MKAYFEIVFLGVSSSSKLATIVSSRIDVWSCMPLHMLKHVPFLSVSAGTVRTNVWTNAFVHADVVKDTPSPSELFSTVVVLTYVVCGNSSSRILSLLNSAPIVLQVLHVCPAFAQVGKTLWRLL